MSSSLDVKKALAIVLYSPEAISQVQSIRKDHDAAFQRWPPHINFVFPFPSLSDLDVTTRLETLAKALQDFEPFDITLDTFDCFKRKRDATVHLVPKVSGDFLSKLHQVIIDSLGLPPPSRPFHPHLTVGQWKKSKVEGAMRGLQTSFTPVTFRVSHLDFLKRGDDTPFMTHITIPLGSS